MKKSSVFVTRMLQKSVMDFMKENFDVEVNSEDRILKKTELLKMVRDKDAVLCLKTDVIDKDILDTSVPRCKIFANYSAGYSNIDVIEATRRGIIITNTPDLLKDATADLAWTLLFSVARRVIEADKFVRAGNFKGWSPSLFLGREITGKTLGIIGSGSTSVNFAKKAKSFNMKILYYDFFQNTGFEKETDAIYVNKEVLLKESDFISLHIPMLPTNKHLIGRSDFEIMKDTAVLINTSGRSTIDEKALVWALKEGKIWGAGLDVYENEHRIEPGLTQLKNVVILPHIAGSTEETCCRMGIMAARNILAALRGERPPNCVNPEVLKS